MRKTLLALRNFSEIGCPEIRAMLIEFVRDSRLIELEQAPVQANTILHTCAAQQQRQQQLRQQQQAEQQQAEQVQDQVIVSFAAPATPPSSLMQLNAEAHSQPPLQVGSDMLVVCECVGDKRKAEQIASALDDGNVVAVQPLVPETEEDAIIPSAKARKSLGPEEEDETVQLAGPAVERDENVSSAKARKNMIQALNSRISSGRSSRCASHGP